MGATLVPIPASRPALFIPTVAGLCDLCSDILHRWHSSAEISVGPSKTLGLMLPVPRSARSYCSFCVLRILAADRIESAQRATGRPEHIPLKVSSTALELYGGDFSVFKNPGLTCIDPTSIPWASVQAWLTECDGHDHVELCTRSKMDRLMKLKLRLIDVHDARLVTIPCGAKFAALSYKWRKEGDNYPPRLTDDNIRLLHQLGALNALGACAQTIKDAMDVCRRVNIRYLWVDALCIVQTSVQKSLDMENMDAIYACAFFTIVPADSESAFQGIHGVSLPRGRLPSDYVDPSWFVSFGVSSVANWMAKSPWAGRAWTYQEATLSRRLLVFTEQLCCLICPKKMFREDGYEEPDSQAGQKNPLVLLQYQPIFDQTLRRFSDWDEAYPRYQSWVEAGLRNKSLKQSPLRMYSIILSSYLKKSLTKSEDILRAFTGIISELHLRMGPFKHGLPRLHLLEALTWHYDQEPIPPGEYFHSRKRFYPLRKRDTTTFPSWSWVGFEHCPGALISLSSRSFDDTSFLTSRPQSDSRMVAVYVENQDQGGLIRLNRSSSDQPEFFDSTLTREDEEHAHHVLNGLLVPRTSHQTLLIFKSVLISVSVGKHPFYESPVYPTTRPKQQSVKLQETEQTDSRDLEPAQPEPQRRGWAMFPIGDEDDKLKMRTGCLTMVHLDVTWRLSQLKQTGSDHLNFLVLGIFPPDRSGSMQLIALVVSKAAGAYYREGLAKINVDPKVTYDQYVESLLKAGSRDLVVLG